MVYIFLPVILCSTGLHTPIELYAKNCVEGGENECPRPKFTFHKSIFVVVSIVLNANSW